MDAKNNTFNPTVLIATKLPYMKGIATHALTKKLPGNPLRLPTVKYVPVITRETAATTKHGILTQRAKLKPTTHSSTMKTKASLVFTVPLGIGRDGSFMASIDRS